MKSSTVLLLLTCAVDWVFGFGGCPSGEVKVDGVCTICPSGTWSWGYVCNPCDPGTFAAQNHTETCTPCAPGTFAANNGSTFCDACPVGYFTPNDTSQACSPCPPGTFAPETGASNCTICPSGTVSRGGLRSCSECLAGFYSSPDQSGCFQCDTAAGFYQPKAGQAKCIDCPSNAFCFPSYFVCETNYGKYNGSCVSCSDIGLKLVDQECVPITTATSTAIRAPEKESEIPKVKKIDVMNPDYTIYIIVGASSIAGIIFCLLLVCFMKRFRKRFRQRKPSYSHNTSSTINSLVTVTPSFYSMKSNSSLIVSGISIPTTSSFSGTTTTAVNTTSPLSLPAYLMIDFGQHLRVEKFLGKGGFSMVYQATPLSHELLERSSGNQVAVKILTDDAPQDKAALDDAFNQEVALMSDLLRDDNFVKILGFSHEPKTIVMKIYDMGDFRDLIFGKTPALQKAAGTWQPSLVLPLLMDLASALAYLHAKDISHNDVKPSNALLDPRSDRLHLVLSDFSFATIRNSAKRGVKAFRFSDADGLSLPYAPPELLAIKKGMSQMSEMHKWPVHSRDAYAFGIVIYEASSRRAAYTVSDKEKLIQTVLSGGRPDTSRLLDEQCQWKPLVQMAMQCWSSDISTRPKLNEITTKIRLIHQSNI